MPDRESKTVNWILISSSSQGRECTVSLVKRVIGVRFLTGYFVSGEWLRCEHFDELCEKEVGENDKYCQHWQLKWHYK